MSRLRMLPLLAALALTTGTALTACDKGGAEDKGEKKAEEGEKADTKAEENAEEAEPTDTEAAEAGEAEGGEAAAETGAEGAEGEETTGGEEAGEAGEAEGGEGEDPTAAGGDDKGGDDKGGDDKGTTKTTKKKDPPKAEPEKASADKANGKTLYLKKCKSCHAPDGSGKTKLGEKYEIESLKGTKLSTSKIVSILVKGIPDTKMKSYKKKLSDQEMQDVAAFVKTL